MSHFFTLVIVPADAPDVEVAARELLAPYDEDIQMPEYGQSCYCVGSIARRSARDAADKIVEGGFEALRERFHKSEKAAGRPAWPHQTEEESEAADQRWQEHIAAYKQAEDAALKAHPLYEKPDLGCEDCHGTGIVSSTYNPKSKWDWYDFGGRWDGVVCGNARTDGDAGFNFAQKYRRLPGNITTIDNVLADLKNRRPYAIVTPDGEWHERGKMGWFGLSSNEQPMEQWLEQVRAIFEKYRSHMVVGVDCHI